MGPGASWSNLAGIAALSVLNTVNAITMPILFWQRGRVRANLPIFGAWLFAVATYSMTDSDRCSTLSTDIAAQC
jgi:hypothetical protein